MYLNLVIHQEYAKADVAEMEVHHLLGAMGKTQAILTLILVEVKVEVIQEPVERGILEAKEVTEHQDPAEAEAAAAADTEAVAAEVPTIVHLIIMDLAALALLA